jgi:hypothetical protein
MTQETKNNLKTKILEFVPYIFKDPMWLIVRKLKYNLRMRLVQYAPSVHSAMATINICLRN